MNKFDINVDPEKDEYVITLRFKCNVNRFDYDGELSDFIEQELKKEREEIVEIVGKEFDRQSESCIQFGHEPILYLPDTKRIIINIIKNRYEQ